MMVKLNEKIREEFAKMKVIYLATASKEGTPNVVPIGAMRLMDDETLWIVDNFMKKTLKNILENPIAAFDIWVPEEEMSYQIKGCLEYVTSGDDYEEARKWMLARKPLPAKGLVKMKFVEIYSVKPGPDAGSLLFG
ncbi:MAG: pyridoxamine 5'-phosphate oxidase family protein [archaeon]|nr:pyridoxamine 5'-phosphate oxidase family protein [archaeon]